MAECAYCVEAGRPGSVALRVVRGKGVCNAHLPDRSFPVVMHAPEVRSRKPEVRIEEGKMPARKINLDVQGMKRDYLSGMNSSDVGDKYGVHFSTVCMKLKAMGVEMRKGKGRPPVGEAQREAWRAKRKAKAIVKAGPVIPSGREGSGLEARSIAAARDDGNGAPKARCRLAMFEVEGDAASVQAAVEAVKAALMKTVASGE